MLAVLPFLSDLPVRQEFHLITKALQPLQEPLNHANDMSHAAGLRVENDAEDGHVFSAICNLTSQPLEAIHPHSLYSSNIDIAM